MKLHRREVKIFGQDRTLAMPQRREGSSNVMRAGQQQWKKAKECLSVKREVDPNTNTSVGTT
jgi:hypothetical protein